MHVGIDVFIFRGVSFGSGGSPPGTVIIMNGALHSVVYLLSMAMIIWVDRSIVTLLFHFTSSSHITVNERMDGVEKWIPSTR